LTQGTHHACWHLPCLTCECEEGDPGTLLPCTVTLSVLQCEESKFLFVSLLKSPCAHRSPKVVPVLICVTIVFKQTITRTHAYAVVNNTQNLQFTTITDTQLTRNILNSQQATIFSHPNIARRHVCVCVGLCVCVCVCYVLFSLLISYGFCTKGLGISFSVPSACFL